MSGSPRMYTILDGGIGMNKTRPVFLALLKSFGTSEVRPSSRESRAERRTKRPVQQEHWAIGFAV